ncbi:MAG: hypothetical protein KAR54_02005 [Candidatus Pacebacteria bacterium]|nr:hypothetical protein [Candidatus Paceibacterota bacterium]
MEVVEITNKSSSPVIAVAWTFEKGLGDEVKVDPNETKTVSISYLGIYIEVPKKIICHELKNEDNCYQVLKGKQISLYIKNTECYITIRHHSESMGIGIG